MIEYTKYTLDNGLTLLTHRDDSTPMAAVNLLYKVGSRNEDPDRTGFAHLFEHLMFGGSVNIPVFDEPVQKAGGENNAFTNNDYTNYYMALPKENLETALWLESDRMLSLAFSPRSLDVQRKVVVEEFAQRYLNQPYGDVWLLLRPLAYKEHPYQWATIGKSVDHIAGATMRHVKTFFKRYYTPSNAILSIVGDFEPDQVRRLVEKWFGDIPSRPQPADNIPAESGQKRQRRLTLRRRVPASLIYMVFHMGPRMSREFTVCDVISDLLSNGTSSRLYQRLVKESELFSSVNAYVSGDMDDGLFVVTGRVLDGVPVAEAEKALWRELDTLKKEPAWEYELEKVKNKYEANNIFGEINVLNKAMNLAFFEMLGDVSLINREVASHNSVTAGEVMATSRRLFTRRNSSVLHYLADSDADR